MAEYPEHERIHAVKEKSQAIGEFIDWLREKGVTLCTFRQHEYWPLDNIQGKRARTIEEILSIYFDIDQDKIEKEKRAMLDELRQAQGIPTEPTS